MFRVHFGERGQNSGVGHPRVFPHSPPAWQPRILTCRHAQAGIQPSACPLTSLQTSLQSIDTKIRWPLARWRAAAPPPPRCSLAAPLPGFATPPLPAQSAYPSSSCSVASFCRPTACRSAACLTHLTPGGPTSQLPSYRPGGRLSQMRWWGRHSWSALSVYTCHATPANPLEPQSKARAAAAAGGSSGSEVH